MRIAQVRLGCEVLCEGPPPWLREARIGLLSNQASVSGSLEHVSALLRRAGGRLECFFSPQHGFHGEKQANMIESGHETEAGTGVPIFSLYGEWRQPTPAMLEGIDVLVVDLPDVGTRVYTYSTTMGLCLEASAAAGIRVVVLDRPNPIGGSEMEGSLLESGHRSFVGRYGVPMRHGLTMGEYARFMVRETGLECDLEVVPMQGWDRRMLFPQTGLPWVYPSPNMPSWETALLYPGMVLLEGTNVSEGRGTTLPFLLFGAPYVDQRALGRRLSQRRLPGVILRPVTFEPVFDKWKGQLCKGFQIHIQDAGEVRPFALGLELVQALLETHPGAFQWLPPPYEYEWEKLPIDIILGNGWLRGALEAGGSVEDLEARWSSDLRAFAEIRRPALLYGEGPC